MLGSRDQIVGRVVADSEEGLLQAPVAIFVCSASSNSGLFWFITCFVRSAAASAESR